MPRQSRPPNYKHHHTPSERSDLPIILALLCIGVVIGFLVNELMHPPAADAPISQETAADAPPPTPMPGDTPLHPTVPPGLGEPLLITPEAVQPERAQLQPTSTPIYSNGFFDAQHFSYAPGFYAPEIQAFLEAQPGDLQHVTFQIGDRSQTFAETVVGMSTLYSINPKIILTLMIQQGYTKDDKELYKHFYQTVIEVRQGLRDYALAAAGNASLPDLVFKEDDKRQKVPHDIDLARYAIARALAKTTEKPEELPRKLDAFLKTYTRLFGDPRVPPADWPPPARPFLTRPMQQPFRITSAFDHDSPFLQRNGGTYSFWGYASPMLPYDGHSGWDYAMKPPDPVLAAADGQVVFAGNSDDGCYTPARAVIIEHGNGYRTLYWHLSAISVSAGQYVTRGTEVGIAGDSGCAYGPHLHFQVQYLGRDVDPYGWCGEGQGPWAANPAGQESVWLWSDMIPPCGPPPPDVIVVDQHLPGFAASGNWEQLPYGYGGSALYAGTISMKTTRPPWEPRPLIGTPAVATWSPTLPHAGRYRVLAYIPHIVNGLDDSREARYRVHHYDGEDDVALNIETYANSWADLGTYYFGPQSTPLVSLSVLAGDGGRGVWVDAMVWEPVE